MCRVVKCGIRFARGGALPARRPNWAPEPRSCIVTGDPHLSHASPDLCFNTNAFQLPPFGSFGNSGRNILNGPSYQTVNVSVVKNIALRERATLQFRTEAFNFLNRPNFDLPDIFLGSPTFGHILSAQNPRHIQFGLKLLF